MSHLPNVYAIISTTDIDNVDFTQVPEENNEYLRYSLDKTEFVIKWFNEHTPTFITDGTVVPLQTLTHAEALVLMASPEWSEPIPVEE
jgi:hypothetical protein